MTMSINSFAITENEAKQCIERYYSYIQEYAEDVSRTVELTKKIQSLFIDGKGSVYNDIFTILDDNPDTDGDVLSYLSSIDKYRKDHLSFIIEDIQVTINSDNTAHLEYKKEFIGGMYIYYLYEEAIIKNGKIVCIYKKGTGRNNQYANVNIKINSVQIAGADGDGNILTSYGVTLEKNKISRIRIKVDYEVSKNTNLIFKMIAPMADYTLTKEIESNYTSKYVNWGWEIPGNFKEGNYKIELWNASNTKLLYTQTFTVKDTQTTTYLTVSRSELYFDASGGTKTITVTSNKDWEISVGTYSWGHLTRNGNTLTLKVDENTESTERTDYFKLTAGDKEVKINITQEAASNSVEIDNVWVDHNITRTGYNSVYDYYWGWQQVPYTYYVMRIHVNFVVNGMKGEKIRVCAFFYDDDGDEMTTTNSNYRAPDGQVTVQDSGIATYENTRWSDFKLEIPYNVMKKGSNKFYIQIQDSDGNALITSDYEYFSVN